MKKRKRHGNRDNHNSICLRTNGAIHTMKYYAGVGSRETPDDICRLMTRIASQLESEGYILRSGRAKGADMAFERGVRNPKNTQIFFPQDDDKLAATIWTQCDELAQSVHPAWNSPAMLGYDKYGQRAHRRDVLQVLGPRLDEPSAFTICWTRDGKEVGGTATAIRVSKMYGIPVINLAIQPMSDIREAINLYEARQVELSRLQEAHGEDGGALHAAGSDLGEDSQY